MTFRRYIASAETRLETLEGNASMFKPLIFSLALTVALCACSKKDDAATNNIGAPPANAVGSSQDAAENGANVTAKASAGSGPESERTAKEVAIPTEAPPKQHKQGSNAAHHSAKGTRPT